MYISYSVADDQQQITLSSRIAFGLQRPLERDGAKPAPNLQLWGRSKNSKGAHLSLLRQRQNTKGNDSTVQGKKITYTNIMINHAT